MASELRALCRADLVHDHSEAASVKEEWYEFRIAKIDRRDLRVLFQILYDSEILHFVPKTSTPHQDGRVHVIATAFQALVVQKALNDMPLACESARDGAKFSMFDVDRTYEIYEADWPYFASALTARLEMTNLSQNCGMSIVRLYTCEHGLKMSSEAASAYLTDLLVDVDHPHVDVMQLHHATNIALRDGDKPLLV